MEIKLYRFLIVLFIGLFLHGCAPTIRHKSIESYSNVNKSNGVLVVNLKYPDRKSIIDDVQLVYERNGDGTIGKLTFYEKSDLAVIELPAGSYRFKYFYFAVERSSSPVRDTEFTVEPGSIVYIGDVKINFESRQMRSRKMRVEVENNVEVIKRILKERYPKLIENMNFKAALVNF